MSDSDARQIQSGTLSGRIIRACTVHKTCSLTCRERRVEELGELAHFDQSDPVLGEPGLVQRVGRWLEHITHQGDTSP